MAMHRRLMNFGFCIAAFAAFAPPASAQPAAFPNRPVRLIIDSAPGSANDVIARLVSDKLGEIWGQQTLVVNQPGAGGGIATRGASSSPNDGYTLYMPGGSTFLALAGAPGVAPNLPIEIPRDFMPIGMVALQPMFIAASHELHVSNIRELLDAARQKPGQIGFAASGRGRITHLTMELMQKMGDVQMQLVAYTGGPNQAMTDIIAGRVGVVLDGYASLAGAMRGNSIKALAVASAQRLREFPDLPTVAETLPGFQAGGWNVFLAPLGTPEPVVNKVSADLRKALEDPALRERLAGLGAFVQPMSPQELIAFAQSEQKTWRPILEKVANESP